MASKKEEIAKEVARAVGAGKPVAMETVDFSDPNRPKTCLEVDFPILPINGIATMEAHAGVTTKPIYQMAKWWARRPSSVFRSMLIAAATKAPDDPAQAAKLVWENYYANHQKKGAFKHLNVADIFMGGGTTLVEGSRLGMQMSGNDLNPVAWFVVKQEFAKIDIEAVKRLLADIETEVKPQIMPFYYCDGPNGEKGTWTHLPTGRIEEPTFDPLSLTSTERKDYKYEGPEIIYTFWVKHGPCQVTGCGHRTPIMTSPVMAVKTLTVKHWPCTCKTCNAEFDVEAQEARMAPDVPLFVALTEKAHVVLDHKRGIRCPKCGDPFEASLGKGKSKKITLSLVAHRDWIAGAGRTNTSGEAFGGSVRDEVASTTRWNNERASMMRLVEVRGALPETVTCPETGTSFDTSEKGGTVPKAANFACGACGTVQPIVGAVEKSGKSAPVSASLIQCYWDKLASSDNPYGGKYFLPVRDSRALSAAATEWEIRRETELRDYWPQSDIPFGHMTHQRQPLPQHGYLKWSDMFNARQMLVHALLLRSIMHVGNYDAATREYVLSSFQQYLRNQNMLSFWHQKLDTLAPALSNNNFHPKSTAVETGVFSPIGYGPWTSAIKPLFKAHDWRANPWELVRIDKLSEDDLKAGRVGNTEKIFCGDSLAGAALIACGSSTEHAGSSKSFDLVVTDPPFGGLLHYSELSDFFYVWLRLALKHRYPNEFGSEYTPKTLEAVANRAREPDDADGYYQRLLTECWREANRVLKPAGILAFTFHHSEDEPWVAVLESLFDAGFYLEATYPIRSDETKGDGEFGSKKIEYDIIHVCRKRTEEPTAVSWGRMRREVLADVKQLQAMLENHAKAGLPAADLQVIKRGKALEYFSRHYGKVFKSDGEAITVKEALVGINQILDEDATGAKDPPPVNAEPITRQFLRIFDGQSSVARDQMQKFLRGSGMAPDDFEQRGWCGERNKIFSHVEAVEFARDWQGRHRRKLTADLDQALLLIGACFDGSGVNAADTLKNENFKPHPALKDLLGWYMKRGADQPMRNAASRALTIYNAWAATHRVEIKQMSLFFDEDEAA